MQTLLNRIWLELQMHWAQGNTKLGSRGKADWLPGFLLKWSICDIQHNTSDYRTITRHETCSVPSDTRYLTQLDQSIAAVLHDCHCLFMHDERIHQERSRLVHSVSWPSYLRFLGFLSKEAFK